MANKRKNEAKEPDAFISLADKVGEALARHKRIVLAVLAIAFLGGGLYIGISQYQQATLKNSQEELYTLFKSLVDKETQLLSPQSEAPQSGDSNDKGLKASPSKKDPQIEKSPQTLTAHFVSELEALESFIEKNQSNASGAMAALRGAKFVLSYKDFDRAQKWLMATASRQSASDVFYGWLYTLLGSVQAEKEQWEDAIASYQKILDVKEQEHLHASVMVKQALVHLKAGNTEKAISLLESVQVEHTDTNAAQNASTYLKVIATEYGKEKG